MHILEKTLRLAYRHASQHQSSGGKTKSFLLGQALTNAGKATTKNIHQKKYKWMDFQSRVGQLGLSFLFFSFFFSFVCVWWQK